MSEDKSKDPINSKLEKSVSELSEEDRRKYLKAGGFLAAGGAALNQWNKPVVDSVLLPAHAQSSGALIGPFVFSANLQTKLENAPSPSPLDWLVQPTHATPEATPQPSPKPTPEGPPSPICPALGQCAAILPPDSQSKVSFTVTNVGNAMLLAEGLKFEGDLEGIHIKGFFTDGSFTMAQGDLTGDCIGTFSAKLGGVCVPVEV